MGTSLTAGFGLDDPDYGYTALIQATLDSLGLPLEIVNAGVSGETSAGGLRRIERLLEQPARVLVLELGANDGLRGQDPQVMRANIQAIIDRARALSPELALVVAGMEAPPNLGADYVEAFRAVFPALAESNDGLLIPFLLEGVAGEATLNQADGIHPNPGGHRRLAATVWEVIGPLLRQVAGETSSTAF